MSFTPPQLAMKKVLLQDLATEYARRISDARGDRDERMQDIWALCLKNYEGKAERVMFPWPDASNAVIPLTPAHTDAWQSRLYNAGTAADPIYMTSAWAKDDLIGDLSTDDYAEIYQQYSKWLEKEEIDNDVMMEKVSTIATKYGNAIVYLPWEFEEIKRISYIEGSDEPVKESIDILNKPVPHVIHPKNFYMDVAEEDLQTAQWCGIDEVFSDATVRGFIASGEWNKKAGEAVLEAVAAQNKKQKTTAKKLGKEYFKRTEDGRILNPDEWDNELQRTVSMPDVVVAGIPFVRVFAREDTDNDGTAEEIEFLIHVESRKIVKINWSRYAHMKRPLTMFSFKWREGTWMAMGVPEMLFNPARIMNELVRDMLDNNKIKNTKIFAVRANGVVDPDEPVFPGRTIVMEDIGADFAAIDMGSSGQSNTSLQDLALIQAWAERRDGMTDFNLGRERSSRTPATTMLALLEEGNERVVSIVRRQRRAQTEVWTQVHQLFVQNGDAPSLDRVVGKESAEKLRAVWAEMDVLDIRKKLVLSAQVSTGELNKGIKRQETAQLMGQLDAFHQRIIQIAQIVRSTDDPVLRALAISMAKSGQFLMRRVLNTHDIKDQADMNPNLADALEKLPQGPPIPEGGNANPAAQVEQAQGQPATQPLNAPGRPEAGIPRADGQGGVGQ